MFAKMILRDEDGYDERRAIKQTRAWMLELADPRLPWKRLRDIRRAARVLLRHYPSDDRVDQIFDDGRSC